MTCCNKNPITIYQGFGTKWDNNDLIRVSFETQISIFGFGAEFTIGNIVKTYTDIQDGFVINLNSQETGSLPLGNISGTLVLIDLENNKRPFSTELPFIVKDWEDGDIKLDGFNISIDAKVQENDLKINISTNNPLEINEETIRTYINVHNLSEEAHPYIQEFITSEMERAIEEENKKVDKVYTTNRIYGTDEDGEQTTYPIDGFSKVDDVQVGGISVVQDKIANLGTMAGETASDYRKASNQDTIDSGLGNRINILESYTPDTASSNNKFAVESEITNLQNTKQDNISDLSTIRSNAQAGKSASDTIATYGNIVTHNISEFATSEQGALADTALQPGDNITELVNNADYATNTQVSSAISNHNTSESAHSYIQELISSEESRAEGVEGTLSNLTTDVKSNLVSAINEIDSHVDSNASDISDIKNLIPNDASLSNQLADKNFVNSSISTNTANFIGTFNSVAELEAYSGPLTNNDYAFIVGTDSSGNTVYDRYKYTDATIPASWVFEYELNNSSFTADQWAAINSLATANKITQITTNQNAIGTLSSLTTTAKTDLVSAINELNSDKLDKNSAITGATKCKITYDGNGLVTGGSDLSASDIPSLTLSKISDITATASELNILDGITASTTELNYTDGVTSNIQTQLNGKVPNIRTINGKALSSDISLDATDVGALPSSTVIPTVNNATLTMQKNGSTIATFTANQSTNITANILVPTDTNDLTNGAGYVTETWVGQQGYITGITSSDIITAIGYTPQQQLISGTNIKTVNNITLLGSGNITVTNTDLSNLTSTGKNIGNWSSNITNCITYIPQDIKLELNNGTLTLKAGSKVYVPNGFEQDETTPKFDEYIIPSDITINNPAIVRNKSFITLNTSKTGIDAWLPEDVYSGSTQPTPSNQNAIWYDTTNNLVKVTSNTGATWTPGAPFPFCLSSSTASAWTSIDQVFNGFGYIGSTVFVLPGLKALHANGRNEDGTLKNDSATVSNVLTFTGGTNNGLPSEIILNKEGTECQFADNSLSWKYYESSNYFIYNANGDKNWIELGTYIQSNYSITSFNPKTVFHALDWNDKGTIAEWSMPSSRYVDLTLGASGTVYTALSNGWVQLIKTGQENQYAQISSRLTTINTSPYNGGIVSLFIPVSKGDEFTVAYDLSGTTNVFRFYYAKGEV